MRLRPPKNLVGMFDVLGAREFRLPNDQVYAPVLLWARLNDRAYILGTKPCDYITIRLCPAFSNSIP